MTNFPKWQDVREDVVAGSGGEQAVAEARHRNQAYIDGHRLAERRKALGLTQAEVAERMGVTKSRVSQIERGEVSTIEALARYVQALGGTSRSPQSSATTLHPPRHRRGRLTATSTPLHPAAGDCGFPACRTSLLDGVLFEHQKAVWRHPA